MGIPGLRTHGKTLDDGPQSWFANPPWTSKNTRKTGQFGWNCRRKQTFQCRNRSGPADPGTLTGARPQKSYEDGPFARPCRPRILPTRVNTLGENPPSLHGTAAQITRCSWCIPWFEALECTFKPIPGFHG